MAMRVAILASWASPSPEWSMASSFAKMSCNKVASEDLSSPKYKE